MITLAEVINCLELYDSGTQKEFEDARRMLRENAVDIAQMLVEAKTMDMQIFPSLQASVPVFPEADKKMYDLMA
jgi:hypothetical protein